MPAEVRRAGLVTLGAGAVLLGAAQLIAPAGGPPLYDGVVVAEPYRYLSPPAGSPGDPTSYSATMPVSGGVSPEIVAATAENPPQAQLIAPQGAFDLGPSSTSITVSISPVPPSAVPTSGQLAGNVYRFSIVDQTGTELSAKYIVTVVLRAPSGVTDATMARLVDGAWVPIDTQHAGQPGMFDANATLFGDFVMISTGGGPNIVFIGGGVVLTIVVVLALGEVLARNRRRSPEVAVSTPPAPRPKPPRSKRRSSRRR
ncbi:MAG TPA: hypothetical protein VEG29_01430 [Candidatus Binatia bacterium]|nr:hypothetical protein [Candidatus Binatia bacterium]